MIHRAGRLLISLCAVALVVSGCALKTADDEESQTESSSAEYTTQSINTSSNVPEEPETEISASGNMAEDVLAQNIYFEQSQVSVKKGETFTLNIIIEPENVSDTTVKWSALDTEVVSCDEDGNFTALSGGSTLVMAKVGKRSAVCTVDVDSPMTGIEASNQTLELDTGTSYPMIVKFLPEDTTDDMVCKYSVDNTDVCVVDPGGNIHTVSNGTANVTVTVGDFESVCTIEVVTYLKKLSFEKESYSINEGDSAVLRVSMSPKNLSEEPKLTYESSDTAVAVVDKNGKVTAKKKGSAVITVSSGSIKASAKVNVTVPMTGIELDEESLSLQKGQSVKINTQLLPENTTDTPDISYGCSNPSVVSVSSDGTVTAVAAGTAVVTVNAGSYSASCIVSVTVPLQSIYLSDSSLTLWKGNTAALTVGCNPSDTTDDKTAVYTSSNTSVATVDAAGNVTAVGDGSCTITATVGNQGASCSVSVSTYVNVTGVTLSSASLTLSSIGQTAQLSASVSPANATNPAVTYTSSNPKVASVSASGVVSAVSGGTAVITVTAENASATCVVTVDLPAASKVVVLDPGHGGSDPGAQHYGMSEKDMTLKVAQYCKAYLEENYSGVTVLLTRSTDTQLTVDETGTDLRARCQYAASVGADVMVSLHFNSTPSNSARGAMALISKQANVTTASAALANSILAQLSSLGIGNRGLVTTDSSTLFDSSGNALDYYAVNRVCAAYGIPGIIVEHCFMDNASDVAFCDSDEDLYNLGVADAVGIAAYLGLPGK